MKINLQLSRSIFNDAYFPLLFDYTHRYEVYYGGAGSGKSVFIAQKLVAKACASKRKVLVIRKYGTTLKDSVYDLVKSTLSKWGLMQYVTKNESTYTLTLPNGSVFLFKGMDDSEKIKSITDITDIWVEEGTELSEDEYTQLDLRLRALAGDLQLIISFNPVSKANWVYTRWFHEDAEVDEATTRILKTTYKDNRFLPAEYVAALEEKQRSNPTYYRIYALGEFCSLSKLVFTNWRTADFDHRAVSGTLCVGLDFGFVNDTSALVASVLDEAAGRLYVFREWGETGKTNPELAAIIDALGFRKSVIIADAAEQKSIEEIKRQGVTRIRACAKGPDSIVHGIQRLQQYELVVHPSCTGLITELENYAWEKDRKTGEYINRPVDAFNHYIDAMRYSLQCVNSNKLRTMDKAKLGL